MQYIEELNITRIWSAAQVTARISIEAKHQGT